MSCVHIGKCSLLPGAGTNKTQPGVRRLSCQAGPGVFFSPNLSRFHFLWSNPPPTLLGPLPTLSFTLCVSPGVTPGFLLRPVLSSQLRARLASWCLSWPRCCVRLKVTVSDCEEVTATPHSVPSVSEVFVAMESHLAEAVEQGDVTSVIQQLRQGADVNLAAGLNGTTALMEAAILGNVDILTILLSCSNINLNQQDLSGQVGHDTLS